MIRLEELTKQYGKYVAVERLTLDVGGGELFGFLGPNGAGKSTLLRVLATLLLPTRGSARVCGYDVGRDPAPRESPS